MAQETQQDRARRIREAQIAARDHGGSKIKGMDWEKHFDKKRHVDTQKKKEAERLLIVVLWENLPTRWKGLFYGLFLGIIIGTIITWILPDEWGIVFIIPPLVFMVVGMVLGKTVQKDYKL